MRCRNAARSRAVNGSASGSSSRPASCPSDNAAGSSSSASGLPAASARSRSRTHGVASGADRPSSTDADSWSSPPRTSSPSPGASNRRRSPSRAANMITRPSAPSRRAVNTSEAADGTSSHWASSTRHRRGHSSAAAASSESTPAETRKRSAPRLGARPRAPSTASRCGSGNFARYPTIGRTKLWRPAKSRSDSPCTPVTFRTLSSSARSAAHCSSEVLPVPASPRRTSAPLLPSEAPSRRPSITAHSWSRPTSPVAVPSRAVLPILLRHDRSPGGSCQAGRTRRSEPGYRGHVRRRRTRRS